MFCACGRVWLRDKGCRPYRDISGFGGQVVRECELLCSVYYRRRMIRFGGSGGKAYCVRRGDGICEHSCK